MLNYQRVNERYSFGSSKKMMVTIGKWRVNIVTWYKPFFLVVPKDLFCPPKIWWSPWWGGKCSELLWKKKVQKIHPLNLTGAFYAGNSREWSISSLVIIPATPSNPSIAYVKRTSKKLIGFQHLVRIDFPLLLKTWDFRNCTPLNLQEEAPDW